MNNFLKRYDILYTVAIFLLMVPAEYFEWFTLAEDESLSYRHIMRWSAGDSAATAFSGDDIVVVFTDEEFYDEYGGFPLRRVDYGVLAKNLRELGASVVAIDALMDYPNSYGEDPATAQLFREAGNVLLVSKADIDRDGRTFLDMTYPTRVLREATISGYSNIGSESALRTRLTRLRIHPDVTKRPDGWPFAVQALKMHWGTEASLGDGELVIGDQAVPLDHGTDFYLDWPELPGDSKYLFKTQHGISAMEILRMNDMDQDELEALAFDVEGKIVLIGDTSEIAKDLFDTPVGQVYGVEVIAAQLDTLIKGAPLRPAPIIVEFLISMAFMGLIIATALITTPATRVLATLLIFAGYVAFAFALYVAFGLVIAMTYNLFAGVIGVVLINARYYFITDETAADSQRESAESNRMLALAFQGQGQLDMAFDKFRKVPLDNSVADLIYNLALDYERKRQFNKAVSVYEYLAGWKPDYRDIQSRLERARSIDANPLAHSGSATMAGTIVTGVEGMEKPSLGRYEVTKELGQGAMGIVYEGEDPKIHRVVAIKTMSLASEFEGEALAEAKERFFREAQSAGRLNHPNIVGIFDAGEEHDLAYIAMEFLKGSDLSKHTKPDNLLPLDEVLRIVGLCAEALAYAHDQGVVHRDVKPSNIMYDDDSGTVKLTDFGIARITDSSKTKTGTVLGTPNYMSPEQALGGKVDGRSDLFSLGVVLYQLSSGRLPFNADSMASLMYKIVNEAHPDIRSVKDEVPAFVRKVIDNALRKEPERRYQDGRRMAEHLKVCRQRLEAARSSA